MRALKLLMTKNSGEAAAIAGDLKALNDSRKEMTQAGVEEAVKIAVEMTKGKAPEQKTVLIPSVLVDRKSVDQYPGW